MVEKLIDIGTAEQPTDLIVVKQLPIIEQRLQEINAEIVEQVSTALDMACTEDTVKEVKKTRAHLKSMFTALETQRKGVKNAVMDPYKEFEDTYKKYVTDVFKPADEQLAAKIAEVEDGLKAQKAAEIKEYYEELAQSLGIDFLPFEKAGIDITLTASKKSLREKANSILTLISENLRMINQQEYAAEILVEYKRDPFHVAAAMSAVTERHRAIEEERKRREETARQEEQQAEVARQVEQAAEAWSAPAPVAVPEEEPTPGPVDERRYTVRFTVKNVTKAQALALKNFLNDGGYDYE